MSERLVALCVGHSRRIAGKPEGGAIAADGKTSEWAFNNALASQIAERLCDRYNRYVVVVNDYGDRSYREAMTWLGEHLREQRVDYAVELHCNAADPSASGHEWWHHHASAKGRRAATELHLSMSRHLPQIPARGVKRCHPGNRGFAFLTSTHCPAVIAEPFFSSNLKEWKTMATAVEVLADAYAAGIHVGMGTL